MKIDTSKPVIFYSDCGDRYPDCKMTTILFENEELCLCKNDIGDDVLFNKKTGNVLTEISVGRFYFAKN